MSKIKSIQINLPMVSEVYSVGETFEYKNDQIVTEIRESSIETEQNFIHIMQVLVGEEIVREFIGTPMRIDYSTDENKEFI